MGSSQYAGRIYAVSSSPHSSDPGNPTLPGSLFAGKYRIEKILGQGGMGMVLAARHLGLDEPVAIKVLLPAMREVPGDCKQAVCDGDGNTIKGHDDTDVPTDDEVCTDDSCFGGAPVHVPAALGRSTARSRAPRRSTFAAIPSARASSAMPTPTDPTARYAP